jgi:hypothetical protein
MPIPGVEDPGTSTSVDHRNPALGGIRLMRDFDIVQITEKER